MEDRDIKTFSEYKEYDSLRILVGPMTLKKLAGFSPDAWTHAKYLIDEFDYSYLTEDQFDAIFQD